MAGPSPPKKSRPNASAYYKWGEEDVLKFFDLRGIGRETTKAIFPHVFGEIHACFRISIEIVRARA